MEFTVLATLAKRAHKTGIITMTRQDFKQIYDISQFMITFDNVSMYISLYEYWSRN